MSTLPTGDALEDRILWLDFEFTGLDAGQDLVVETGLIVTDYRLDRLARFTSFVSYPVDEVSELMDLNPWWQECPEHRKVMLEGVRSAPDNLEGVATRISSFVSLWCDPPIVLAGNSIYNDRKWVDRDFPDLSKDLHYRMIDVSTVKLIAQSMLGITFGKNETHRALDDIEESIEELRFLLTKIGSNNLRAVLGTD